MKLNKIFYLITLFALVSCNSSSTTTDQDKLTAKVTTFQTAVTAKDNNALKAIVATDANDYSILQAGTYFSASSIFSSYIFVYSSLSAQVSGTTATVTAKVAATDRTTNLPVSFPITATFSFKQVTGDWYLTQLAQVKTPGGSEDVLLDNLQEHELLLLELLEANNGTILY